MQYSSANKHIVKFKKRIYMCSFENSEFLIRGICEILKNKISTREKSRLYTANGKYYLIIETKNNLNKTLLGLKEYCEYITKNLRKISYTEEYSMRICNRKAIETIIESFDIKAP